MSERKKEEKETEKEQEQEKKKKKERRKRKRKRKRQRGGRNEKRREEREDKRKERKREEKERREKREERRERRNREKRERKTGDRDPPCVDSKRLRAVRHHRDHEVWRQEFTEQAQATIQSSLGGLAGYEVGLAGVRRGGVAQATTLLERTCLTGALAKSMHQESSQRPDHAPLASRPTQIKVRNQTKSSMMTKIGSTTRSG